MRTRPREDLRNLTPIADILKFKLFNGGTGDDHTIEFLIPHLGKVAIEHHHMFDGRILRCMALQLHKADFQLQGRVGKQTNQIRLCGNLQRHQIQNHDSQRTDILRMSAGIVHHKYVFLLQQVNGRQSVG